MTTRILQGATRDVPIDDLIIDEQVRKDMDRQELDGLMVSIKEHGQLQPVLVCPVENGFRVVAGERRCQALKQLGAKTIRVTIVEGDPDEGDILTLQLVENLQRAELHPMDIANGIQALIAAKGWKAAQVAGQLGITAGMVSKYLSVPKLSKSHQAKVASGEIPLTAAYELSRVENEEERENLANDLLSGKLNRDGLSKAIKARAKPATAEKSSTVSSRATASLPGGRTVTVVGPALDLETFIAALEELLSHARKERSKGIGLSTFVAMLRDQSLKSTLMEV